MSCFSIRTDGRRPDYLIRRHRRPTEGEDSDKPSVSVRLNEENIKMNPHDLHTDTLIRAACLQFTLKLHLNGN